MALQSSGPISLNDVAGEFGGSQPHALSEYYGVDTGVPSSGQIALSNFYGKTAEEPGPPRYTFSDTKYVQMGRVSSTPGFGGRLQYIDHYPIRSLDGISSNGVTDAGLFTEGQRTAYPPTYSDLQGVALNEFNRFSISAAPGASWNFTDYTFFKVTVGSGASNDFPISWDVTNPIWSVHSSGIVYLSGGSINNTSGYPNSMNGAVGLGQHVAQCVDALGQLYIALDFIS
jgi:hypothetical protein